MDKILLGEMMGLKFKQTSKLEKDEKGLKHCIFKGYPGQFLVPARIVPPLENG